MTNSELPQAGRYAVAGLTCGHCAAAVRSEVSDLTGVTDVQVDLLCSNTKRNKGAAGMLDVARVEMQFGEQTGRVVLFLLVLGPVLAGGWYLRQRAATADIQRLQRLAGLPDPGSDRAALESRLLQRQSGRILGIAAPVLAGMMFW